MKLADWLFEKSMTPTILRRRLGIHNRSTVHRWIYGERIPTPIHAVAIDKLTQGQVTLADFLDPEPPECAIVITLAGGKTKWILPWSRTTEEQLESPHEPELDHDELSIPVRRALSALGRRAIELTSGMYRIDDRVTDTSGLIRKANETLHRNDQDQIVFPGVKKIGGEDDG